MLRMPKLPVDVHVHMKRRRHKVRDLEPMTELRKGEKIRLNQMGSPVETVLSQYQNIVETYEGHTYHVTKIVRARDAEALPPLAPPGTTATIRQTGGTFVVEVNGRIDSGGWSTYGEAVAIARLSGYKVSDAAGARDAGRWGVWASTYGGVTGSRESWVKGSSGPELFASKEEAEAAASKYRSSLSGRGPAVINYGARAYDGARDAEVPAKYDLREPKTPKDITEAYSRGLISVNQRNELMVKYGGMRAAPADDGASRDAEGAWSFQKWMQYAEAELMRLHGLDASDLPYDWRAAHLRGTPVREAVDRAAAGARV